MTLDEIFDRMPSALNAEAAAGVDATIQFNCSTPRTVSIKDGVCTVAAGSADEYTVAVTMEDDDLAALLTGELDGMSAFMGGRVRADGDIMIATQLASLFPPA